MPNLVKYVKNNAFVPRWLKSIVLRHLRLFKLRKAIWLANDPYVNDPPVSAYEPKYPYILGIIKEFWHAHWPYIAACRDLRVAYKVLDVSDPEWIDVIEQSGCDAFLVWPSAHMTIWKQMYEERLKIMTEELGRLIYPSYKEVWMYESKRKMYYWLRANRIPHARTWIFYDLDQALNFANKVQLPIVFKSDHGAGSSGVIIFRNRSKLERFIKKCFKRGFLKQKAYPLDRQWGNVLFQEYVPDATEWRVIRIANSYFAYEKLKVGDFHSGSHAWQYSRPKLDLLRFFRDITEKANFSSMDFDIFETKDGKYLVSEMQTVFGMGYPYEMCVVEGKPGRMVYQITTDSWRFEEGNFCQNYLCNQRVLALLDLLENNKESILKA